MTDVSARLSAAVADRYRVEREIGQGGMATVYLAHDVRHDRDVAIKVLHEDLGATLGPERFLAEIKTTAKLQHPHILPLIDSGNADGQLFYVMPFVEGETLRARLARETQLPIDVAIRIAREVADALAYAHARGVIHRDIKPENILLQGDHALVADFGIALAVQQAGGPRMTQTGLSLGTPQYMSPEQAMGEKQIDARADIYALGAVTYEMLVGEAPFTGPTMQAIVARLLAEVPRGISAQRSSVSPTVDAAVMRALEKLPADRYATATEFAAALIERAPTPFAAKPAARERQRIAPVLLGVVAIALVAAGGAFAWGRNSVSAARVPAAMPTFATLNPEPDELWSSEGGNAFAMSPDGRTVAVVARHGAWGGLLLRSLDSLGSRYLTNTRQATLPFWSPDGRSIGFFADQQLKIMDLSSGAVRALCPAIRPAGGTWGADDVILYVPEGGSAIHRTTASGGCTAVRLSVSPAELTATRPYFFGDGRHFILTSTQSVWLGRLDDPKLTRLAQLDRRQAVAAGPDYLLYTPVGSPSSTVFAQRIDFRAGVLTGTPIRLLDRVPNPGGRTALAASNSGALAAMRRFDPNQESTIGVFTAGLLRDSVVALPATFGAFAFSHDGKRIAFGGWTIALFDIDRRTWTEPNSATQRTQRTTQFPVWSPRDTAIAFVTGGIAAESIAVVNVRTAVTHWLTGDSERVRRIRLTDWSRDGRYLIFVYRAGGGSPYDEAWLYELSSGQRRRMFEAAGDVSSISFSPDGRFVAYELAEGDRHGVFVRPFAGGSPAAASPKGGRSPRWSARGRELYYVNDDAIVAVAVGDDGRIVGQSRTVLSGGFDERPADTFVFDLSPDGTVLSPLRRSQFHPLTVMLDWWSLTAKKP